MLPFFLQYFVKWALYLLTVTSTHHFTTFGAPKQFFTNRARLSQSRCFFLRAVQHERAPTSDIFGPYAYLPKTTVTNLATALCAVPLSKLRVRSGCLFLSTLFFWREESCVSVNNVGNTRKGCIKHKSTTSCTKKSTFKIHIST